MNGRRIVVFVCRRMVKLMPSVSLSMALLTVAYYGVTNTWPSGPTSKTILIWDTRNHIDLQFLMDRHRFGQCAISHCVLSNERTMASLQRADAVVFNMPPLRFEDFPLDPHRRREQRYIFLSPEPPVLFAEQQISRFNRIFNWTMSYRPDSDIPYLYGDIKANVTTNSVQSLVPSAKSKTKLVAWFASHCFTQSRREAYVDQLSRHIRVDIYGACSDHQRPLECRHNETTHLSDDSCYDMLERHYKFYLAFENSLCNDYVTEKFFQILSRRVIPVVLGRANYSTIAPPHSYIDARRYSPQRLAAILHRLANNDTLYDAFFDWKRRYSVRQRYPDMATETLCRLCQKLHTDQTFSVYDDLESSWGSTSQCIRPRYKALPLVFGVF